MRISEDRYFRDLRHLLLAARMLKLEARTRTICTWTGMPRDRIRKLAISTSPANGHEPRIRHRGRSPRQTAYFFRSPRIYAHANMLACYFAMADLLPRPPEVITAKAFRCVARGEVLCEIYESFYSPPPERLIDFERGILLATALAARDEVDLGRCGDCAGLVLLDRLAPDTDAARRCQSCKVPDSAESICLDDKEFGHAEPMQMRLFDGIDGAEFHGFNGSTTYAGEVGAAGKSVGFSSPVEAYNGDKSPISVSDIPDPDNSTK